MVPYRLVRIITSNCQGLDTSCMQQLSMIMSLVVMSGYSFDTRRQTSRKRPSVTFMMFALWIKVTFFLPLPSPTRRSIDTSAQHAGLS